jgi:hypothetical protein
VALVGEEEVPESLGAGALADLDQHLRIGNAGADFLVEALGHSALVRVDVLVHEGEDALAEALDLGAGAEVHCVLSSRCLRGER